MCKGEVDSWVSYVWCHNSGRVSDFTDSSQLCLAVHTSGYIHVEN